MQSSRQPHRKQYNSSHKPKGRSGSSYCIYGKHSVVAALENPARICRHLFITRPTLNAMPELAALARGRELAPTIVETMLLTQKTSAEATHQGIVLEVEPLPALEIEEVIEREARKAAPLLLLDQVTDPHNVGAILRSAAAFGARAVVTTELNAPAESGVLAKSASGALEKIPFVKVTNLARAMALLKDAGYWCLGLDGEAQICLHETRDNRKVALILGAEGRGLRRLTAEQCDLLVKLPISEQVESLNVSNAAAVALYQLVISE